MSQEEIVRGEEAKRILESKVFKDSMSKLKESIVNELSRSNIKGEHATTEQSQLIMLLQVSNNFERIINDVINTGKLAAKQLI